MVRCKAGAVWLLGFVVAALVSACGGGGGGGGAAPAASNPTYSVSGAVSGLAGTGLVLQDNGGDNLTVNANGTFVFPKTLASGAAYKVTVLTQPGLQTCTVNNGTGTVNGANVSNVSVVCATTAYTVSGTVSGLVGTGLVLLDNGGNNLAITGNGAFTFASPLAVGANYNVTVGVQPSGPSQTCTVNGGTGTGMANVTGITVTCSTNAYTVSGTVTGLSGAGLVLQNNGGDNLSIAANGAFAFTTPVVSGTTYNVTVFTQPTGPSQTCTVSGGTGTMAGANITNVAVNCTTNTYTIGGTVTGLSGAGLVLQNNGGDNLSIAANGAFVFATPVASGGSYNVTVGTQPSGPTQTCTVNTGTGLVTGSNISNVAVVCSTNTYTVSGNVSGLSGTGLVLLDNGGNNLAITANGAFTFTTPVSSGSTYTVTVGTQPSGPAQTCTVTNFTGSVTNANITNVAVTCSINTYTISGTVSGYAGTGLVLMNNGGNFLNITANGSFTFTTSVASGGTYSVAVSSQPTGPAQTCTVSGGTGTVTNASITNIAVSCATNSYTISGNVSGLTGTGMVLQLNGANNTSIVANGPFGFLAPVFSGFSYSVTILTQPAGQVCSVINGSGTVGSTAILNVAVYCPSFSSPRYAFSANSTDNSVSSYVVDGVTGRLKYISKAAIATSAQSVAVDIAGKYAYVANSGGISQYTIGANGTLIPMVPAIVPAGTTPAQVMVDPTGRFVFAVNTGSNDISAYTIGAGGALTQTACAAPAVCSAAVTANFAAGTSPSSVTVDTAGLYAYVANTGSSNISQFTIGAGGALIPMATPTVAAGLNVQSVTLDPSGSFAYAANGSSQTVSQYTVAAGGALVPLASAPSILAGGLVMSIAIDPTAKYAYVADAVFNRIAQYTIGANGGLVPMAPAVVAAKAGANSVVVDPSGKYVYVADKTGNAISEYKIGASGALTPIGIGSVAQAGAASIAVARGAAPVPGAQYAYVANAGSNSISQYALAASGVLAPLPTPAVAAASAPYAVTVDSTNRYAYAANFSSNNITQYTVGAGGGLTPMATPTAAAGAGPWSIAVDPAGRYAYAANYTAGTVSQYTIGANGALTPMTPASVAAGTNPDSVAVDPSGQYVYVANFTSGDIYQYTIGAGGGLTPMIPPTVVSGSGPTAIAIDPSGQYAYVTNFSNGTSGGIAEFAIGVGGGLTPLATPFTTSGKGPNAIAIDPTGKYLAVTCQTDSSIWWFSIGANGTLTGVINGLSGASAGSSPDAIAIDATGTYYYTANYTQSTISQFWLGPLNQSVSAGPLTATAGGPSGMVTTGTWK